MTVKKVITVGLLVIIAIIIFDTMNQKKLQRKIEYFQSSIKELDEKKEELNQVKAFIQSKACQIQHISLLTGRSEWAKAYVYDLVDRTLKDENFKGSFQLGDPQNGEFFPEILKINEIPITITLGEPEDYFSVIKLIEHFEEEQFFLDSLVLAGSEGNFGEGLALFLKYFYREG